MKKVIKKPAKKPAKVIKEVVKEVVETPEDNVKEIQVIEKIIQSKEIDPQDAFGRLTRQQIDLIKRTIAKGADDDELRLFIQVCKGANLNPFLKQVFLVKRWDSRLGKEVATIQVSIDGFRSIAESSGNYAGNDDPIFGDEQVIKIEEKGKPTHEVKVPEKATVTVYKLMDGQRFGFTATARWSEYYPGVRMGFQWHIRPFLMLGKCAEALALRKAFPKLLSGMYEESEMQNTGGGEASVPTVNASSSDVFNTLVETIKRSTVGQLEKYREKISAPGKKLYTEEQRTELLKLVDLRIKEIKEYQAKQKADKK